MPLLRVSIFFIVGILLGNLTDHLETDLFAIILIHCIIMLGLWMYNSKSFSIQILISVLSIVLSGFYAFYLNQPTVQKNYFGHSKSAQAVLATVHDVSFTGNYFKTIVDIDSLIFESDNQKLSKYATGKALVYLKPNHSEINAGNQILFEFNFQAPNSNPNPKTFDYAQYLSKEHIHHIAYLKANAWKKLESTTLSSPYSFFLEKRSWIKKTIDHYFKRSDHAAILKAISIGERSDISEELNTAFVDTGSVHVLAISGLHVGVITSLFIYLLSVFKNQTTKIVIALLALAAIWSFALISGAGPSVQRASLMFSLFIITKLSTRRVSVYNVLGGSALILLLIDPLLVFKLGFQFSYLAVISIVAFYPIFKRFLPSLPGPMSKFSDIFFVSLAAQVLVSPISMYHFHQISLMSAISSLIAIPAIIVLVYSLVVFLFIRSIDDSIIDYLVKLMEFVLDLLTNSMTYLSFQPWCKLEGFYPDTLQVMVAYLFLFSILFLYKQKRIGLALLALALILNTGSNFEKLIENTPSYSNETIVYSTQKGIVIDCFLSNYRITYQSEEVAQKDLKFNCEPFREFKNSEQNILLFEDVKSGITNVSFENKNLCFIKDQYVDFVPEADHVFLIGDSFLADHVISQLGQRKIYSERKLDAQINHSKLSNKQVIII